MENGRLIVSAYIDASHPTVNRAVRGRYILWVDQNCERRIVMIRRKISITVLKLETSCAHCKWNCSPFLVNELRKRARFSSPTAGQSLRPEQMLKSARQASLPEGLSTISAYES